MASVELKGRCRIFCIQHWICQLKTSHVWQESIHLCVTKRTKSTAWYSFSFLCRPMRHHGNYLRVCGWEVQEIVFKWWLRMPLHLVIFVSHGILHTCASPVFSAFCCLGKESDTTNFILVCWNKKLGCMYQTDFEWLWCLQYIVLSISCGNRVECPLLSFPREISLDSYSSTISLIESDKCDPLKPSIYSTKSLKAWALRTDV